MKYMCAMENDVPTYPAELYVFKYQFKFLKLMQHDETAILRIQIFETTENLINNPRNQYDTGMINIH